METSIQSSLLRTHDSVATKKKTLKFWEEAEFNRYGISATIIVIIGCMGGIAAAFGTGGNMINTMIVSFPTTLCLAFILSVSPMRLIIVTSTFAVLIDVVMLILQNSF